MKGMYYGLCVSYELNASDDPTTNRHYYIHMGEWEWGRCENDCSFQIGYQHTRSNWSSDQVRVTENYPSIRLSSHPINMMRSL